jgi:hypothetical protein
VAIFYCEPCDKYIDADWHGCVPYGDDLICEDCAEEMGLDHEGNPVEEDDGQPSEAQEWHDFDPDC